MITLQEIKDNIDNEVGLDELDCFTKTKKIGNLLVTSVDSYGGEGQGESYYSVVKITREDGSDETYMRTDGFYSSYDGVEHYGGFDSCCYLVEPVQVMKTEYKRLKND